MVKKSVYKKEKKDWEQNCPFYISEEKSIFRKYLNNKMLDFFSIKKGNILDIGCATGQFLDLLPSSCKKYGIDFSENFIDYAKKHRPHLQIKLASAEKAPFADNSFDGIIFKGMLHHAKAQGLLQESLAEADRLLKPGGKIYIHDRCDSFLGQLLHDSAIYTRQLLRTSNLLKSTCASDNEPKFGMSDLNFLTKNKHYKLIKQKPILNIFFFLVVIFTNTLQYLFSYRLAEFFRIVLYPFILFPENIFTRTSMFVEELIVFEKDK